MEFQFQYGSIKSIIEIGCSLAGNDFNSNMVRLKDFISFIFLPFFHHFNSNMVRLKVETSDGKKKVSGQFQFQYGSIKRGLGKPFFTMLISFQFQYGSIKSFSWSQNKINMEKFQFQYGSIKSSIVSLNPNSISLFQFQYGSIKRVNGLLFSNTFIKISIPIWFD